MPESKKKELYIASSIGELNKKAECKVDRSANPKIYYNSAFKVFRKAEENYLDGDEEQSYVLYMKYFNIIGGIRKTKQFQDNKDFYQKLISPKNSTRAIEQAERLQNSLQKRYEEREAEALLAKIEEREKARLIEKQKKNEKKSLSNGLDNGDIDDELDSLLDLDVTDSKPPTPKPKVGQPHSQFKGPSKPEATPTLLPPAITAEELYNLLFHSDDPSKVLVIDTRPKSAFERCHIHNSACINVPGEFLVQGITVGGIERRLLESTRQKWKQRGSKDYIILLDHCSKYSTLDSSSKLQSLKDAIYNVDKKITVATEPLILDGGFNSWMWHYPSLTTNPGLPEIKPDITIPEVSWKDIDYPTLPGENESSPPDNTIQKPVNSRENGMIRNNFKISEEMVYPSLPNSNDKSSIPPSGGESPGRAAKTHTSPGNSNSNVSSQQFYAVSSGGSPTPPNQETFSSPSMPSAQSPGLHFSPSPKQAETPPNLPSGSNKSEPSLSSEGVGVPPSYTTAQSLPGVSITSSQAKLQDQQLSNELTLQPTGSQISGSLKSSQHAVPATSKPPPQPFEQTTSHFPAQHTVQPTGQTVVHPSAQPHPQPSVTASSGKSQIHPSNQPQVHSPGKFVGLSSAKPSIQSQMQPPVNASVQPTVQPRVQHTIPPTVHHQVQPTAPFPAAPAGQPPAPSQLKPPVQPPSPQVPSTQGGSSQFPQLPPGWERVWDKSSGRYYFKDHKSQTTHWNFPPFPNIPQQRMVQHDGLGKNVSPKPQGGIRDQSYELGQQENSFQNNIPPKSKTDSDNQTQISDDSAHNASSAGINGMKRQQDVKPEQSSLKRSAIGMDNRNLPKQSGSLSRSLSSPNLAKLSIGDPSQPVVDRSAKPSDIPTKRTPAVNRGVKPLSNHQLDSLNPVTGGIGRALTGLRNLGNTCYMNSVIQCISNTTLLAEYFLTGRFHVDLNRTNPEGTRGQVAEEIALIIRVMYSGQYRSISPVDLKRTIGRFSSQFAGFDQQDSQELLTFLMTGLHEDVNKVKRKVPLKDIESSDIPDLVMAHRVWEDKKRLRDDSIFMDLFQGQYKSSLICRYCGKKSVTFDTFTHHSIPLPSHGGPCTLSDCLKLFSRKETVAWKCPKCHVEREAYKSIEIWRLPPVLIIHLKRFAYEGMWRHKLQNAVDFPVNSLDMSQHVLNASEHTFYHLYAVSNHYGTMQGGHYTAFCKNVYNKRWYTFDDQIVSEMSVRDIKTSAGYLLFYTSVDFTSPSLF